jgi:hypothetical protein
MSSACGHAPKRGKKQQKFSHSHLRPVYRVLPCAN